MSIVDELAFLDATAQADLVRRKEIKATELVDAAIERIERLNPSLNAVVTPMYDEARKLAAAPLPEGPFSGVPFLLKDLVAFYGGVRLTLGSAIMKDFAPKKDSELVRRLKQAGLIVLGKTNTPEYGLVATTEPSLFGACHNPWNTDRTPGGSSGGSAAAVIAGMVPMAHANDGAGSIRIPASCCGLFGLKPTRARNPLGPNFGDLMTGLVAEHAVTRSVRDSAALLDATAGPDMGDPYWAPPLRRPTRDEVGADPGKLRIAFSTDSPCSAMVHPDCVQATREAAELCSALGHAVEEAAPQIRDEFLMKTFPVVWSAGCASTIDRIAQATGREPQPDWVEPLTWELYQMGRGYRAPDYLNAVQDIQKTARKVSRFFSAYDIWLTPTLSEPPLPLGEFKSVPEDPLHGFWRTVEFVHSLPICNATGQPGMSVPLFWNAENLPIGVHFSGRFGDEATLFRLAAQLEEARPWAARRPPVCA